MFDYQIQLASAIYDVPISWIQAVIQTESSWNPYAYRYEPKINDASYGLMQLLTSTARGLGYGGTPDGLFDPDVNVDLGTRLLAQLRGRFGNDFTRVYSAYNSGSPDKWLTSSQVAAHVAVALQNLEQYTLEVVSDVAETVQQNQGGAAAVFVLGLALLSLRNKRRR